MEPIITLNADMIVATYPLDDVLAIVEHKNGMMRIADVEDLEDHGEAFTIGIPGKKFPPKMKHADRIEYMKRVYRDGR